MWRKVLDFIFGPEEPRPDPYEVELARVRRLQEMREARARLREELEREPTVTEILVELGY